MPKIYSNCNGWGNNIAWYDWSTRKVYGHVTPVPEVGDFWEHRMKSGNIAVFQFVKVERQSNPTDMFFAHVRDCGYKKSLSENYHEVLPGIETGEDSLSALPLLLFIMAIGVLIYSVVY